ncbi:MAG TPA: FixG Ig-like domain-containing protein, partial [Gemmatimonadaceae bacterium]|nr:FixG Ig-like domain-containing protein [Gemmatimonadaceae bacterium]
GTGEPFTRQDDGRIANQVRVKIANRTRADRDYRIEVGGADAGTVIVPQNPLRVAAGETATTTLFVLLPRHSFDDGEHHVTVRVTDGAEFATDIPYRLVGPDDDDDDDDERDRGRDADRRVETPERQRRER